MVKKLLLGGLALSLVAAAWAFWPDGNVRLEYSFGTVTLTQKACTNKKVLALAAAMPPFNNGTDLSAMKEGSIKSEDGTLPICYISYDETFYFFLAESGQRGLAPKKP